MTIMTMTCTLYSFFFLETCNQYPLTLFMSFPTMIWLLLFAQLIFKSFKSVLGLPLVKIILFTLLIFSA